MSHTHEDRVADRPPELCAAYGCPLHGTMATSTSGGSEWWCYLHHGREGAEVQQITSAIMRHRWLADALTTALEVHPSRDRNEERMDWIAKTLAANRREDLQWKGHPENVRQWTNRIKPALEQLVLADLQAPAQAEIPGARRQKEQRVVNPLIPMW